jgi:hypothetical protein
VLSVSASLPQWDAETESEGELVRKSWVVAPTVAIVGFAVAAALAASAGSFADPLPGPRDAVILPTPTGSPLPRPTATGSSGGDDQTAPSAVAANTHPATQPAHQATGSTQQPGSGQATGSGQGKRQQGQAVSNPGPKHP